MEVLQLKLINFRNYDNYIFNFSNKKNIIIGNNGTGKTNIVEAIYYLSLTKSFRVNNDYLLIKENQDYSVIEASILDKIENKFKIIIEKNNKRVFINNNQIRKISDYISQINIILFSPDDLKLIKESPSIHRKLINMELSQLSNDYLKDLSIYNKILKQRNTYLKQISKRKSFQEEYLKILTEKLIEYGLKIHDKRQSFIYSINLYLSIIFEKITQKKGLVLKYESSFTSENKEELVEKYKKSREKDILYGKTNIGIHLDDFNFYYNDILAKNFLSEGEQKNAIISFKLAEIEVFFEQNKTLPILILDDLFSEIDKSKVQQILKMLKKDMQIFITTTDLENIDEKILKGSKIFNIKEKKIEEKTYE